jgi:hypothetical protein
MFHFELFPNALSSYSHLALGIGFHAKNIEANMILNMTFTTIHIITRFVVLG